MPLSGQRILLGISGGIAAYKSAEIVRLLVKSGAAVRVMLTDHAKEFITPLTLQALSGHAVSGELFDAAAEAGMSHIALAKWPTLVLIAPATANVIAKLSHGLADDLLTTVCLASTAPLAIAPAMNQAMYAHAATQHNLHLLAQRHVHILGPAAGTQACGDVGLGRMQEPADIVASCQNLLSPNQQDHSLKDKTVLITAGPTQEPLDPVRYLSNHSSGKMGFALASEAAKRGAKVILIAGPVTLPTPQGNIERCDVITAQDMFTAVQQHIATADIFIGCAAVADYRPQQRATEKIKKQPGATTHVTLDLVENPDILAYVGHLPQKPFTIGFAAETDQAQLLDYARQKLQRKGCDLLAVNDVSAGKGFNQEDNALTLLSPTDAIPLPLCHKTQLAHLFWDAVLTHLPATYPELE